MNSDTELREAQNRYSWIKNSVRVRFGDFVAKSVFLFLEQLGLLGFSGIALTVLYNKFRDDTPVTLDIIFYLVFCGFLSIAQNFFVLKSKNLKYQEDHIVTRVNNIFQEARLPRFGLSGLAGLEQKIRDSSKVLMIGGSQDGIVTILDNYGQEKLQQGHQIQIVFFDPNIAQQCEVPNPGDGAVQATKIRFNIERIKRLKEANADLPGGIEIRLFPHNPAFAVTLCYREDEPIEYLAQYREWDFRNRGSMYCENEAQHISANAPTLILKKTDGLWFTHFQLEAERIWASSKSIN
ncbi:hypothetical protein M0E84_03365 [Corynebacterium sp. CCM 9186]|uniref:hypothetical protein n=1 Tax=Corynebacterium TaxID=1716 RepID=UPI0020057A73|nr:hypothetical protein [Corynebacterium meridianum]MCK7677081.1 hypothetical protein [Corynebacterium meridianum]